MRIRVLVVALAIATTAGCSSADSGEDSPNYTVVEKSETGIGTEAVVSVDDSTNAEAIFNEVLDDHQDFASVYMVCAGDDVREDGFFLYGRADGDDRDIVSHDQDPGC